MEGAVSALWGFGQKLPMHAAAPKVKRELPPEIVPTPPPREVLVCPCPVCGRPFRPKPSALRRGHGYTCSLACRVAHRQATLGADIRMRIIAAVAVDGLMAREIASIAGLCVPTTMRHLRAMASDGLVEEARRTRIDSAGRPRWFAAWRLAKAEAAE